jgi:hypothetical protein
MRISPSAVAKLNQQIAKGLGIGQWTRAVAILERRPGTKNSKPERAGSKSYRVFSRLERTILGRPECSSQSVSH